MKSSLANEFLNLLFQVKFFLHFMCTFLIVSVNKCNCGYGFGSEWLKLFFFRCVISSWACVQLPLKRKARSLGKCRSRLIITPCNQPLFLNTSSFNIILYCAELHLSVYIQRTSTANNRVGVLEETEIFPAALINDVPYKTIVLQVYFGASVSDEIWISCADTGVGWRGRADMDWSQHRTGSWSPCSGGSSGRTTSDMWVSDIFPCTP